MRKYLGLLFGAIVITLSSIQAEEVIIETAEGESYLLNVDGNDSFERVLETIAQTVDEISPGNTENMQGLQMHFASPYARAVVVQVPKKLQSSLRSYATELTTTEKDDITYILRTLANSSLPKIKSAESTLKKAGDRIDHIHPLHFLGHIFTSEELKVCARNIRERSWVWSGFVNGSIVTLTEENKKNNVASFLQNFADRVKIDVNLLIPLQQAGKWERFVTTLIDNVPREAGGGRYDQ